MAAVSAHDRGNAGNPVELLSNSSSSEEDVQQLQELPRRQQQQQQQDDNVSDDSSSDEEEQMVARPPSFDWRLLSHPRSVAKTEKEDQTKGTYQEATSQLCNAFPKSLPGIHPQTGKTKEPPLSEAPDDQGEKERDHVANQCFDSTPAAREKATNTNKNVSRDAVSLSPISFLEEQPPNQQQKTLTILPQKGDTRLEYCRGMKRTLVESSSGSVMGEHPADASAKKQVVKHPGAPTDDNSEKDVTCYPHAAAEDFQANFAKFLKKSMSLSTDQFIRENMSLSDCEHLKAVPPESLRRVMNETAQEVVQECLQTIFYGVDSWKDSSGGLHEELLYLDDGELADDEDASIESIPEVMEKDIEDKREEKKEEEEEEISKLPRSQTDNDSMEEASFGQDCHSDGRCVEQQCSNNHVEISQDFAEGHECVGDRNECRPPESQKYTNKAALACSTTCSTSQGSSGESVPKDKDNPQTNSRGLLSDSDNSGNESSDPEVSSDEEFMPNGTRTVDGMGTQGEPSVDDSIKMCEEDFGFCCAKCRCDPSKKYPDHRYIEDDRGVFHRACCHNIILEDNAHIELYTDRVKALEQAVRKSKAKKQDGTMAALNQNKLDLVTKRRRHPKPIGLDALEKRFEAARSKVQRIANMAFEPTTEAMAITDQRYVDNSKFLRELGLQVQKKGRFHGVTVLDCFSGIGTLLVALKRLGIAVNKYIYNEYDLHARHVFRWNHDRDYNPSLPNCEDSKIDFVYDYQRFEDICNNLDIFMEQYAPIDIVGAGPPCQSFTPINACRKGVNDKEGLLFIKFAELVNSIRAHRLQRGKPLFFFAENVELRGSDLAEVERAFDCPRLILDAQEWSPCSRKRMFFTNLLVPKSKPDWERIDSKACLENGWKLPGDVFSSNGCGVKANTFMASLGRIDDKRMMVVKKMMNGYHKRTFSVVEREKMMGYPQGYVKEPIKELYDVLLPAFAAKDGYEWKQHLDSKYHGFSGIKFKLHGLGFYSGDGGGANLNDPCFELKLAPPQTGIKPVYFDADGYAKHLIGNAYSVPVAVELLRCLENLFESAHYQGYEYPYEWEK